MAALNSQIMKSLFNIDAKTIFIDAKKNFIHFVVKNAMTYNLDFLDMFLLIRCTYTKYWPVQSEALIDQHNVITISIIY